MNCIAVNNCDPSFSILKMTAETAVCKEVFEAVAKPAAVTEERGELCTDSNKDQPKPESNGENHCDHEEISHQDQKNNDDNSYVFVSGEDDHSDDPSVSKHDAGENLSVAYNSEAVEVLPGESDAQNGKINEPLETEIGAENVDVGSPLLDKNLSGNQENSIGDGIDVQSTSVDALKEQNEKIESGADAEVEKDEVQTGNTASTEEVEIEQVQNQNEETGGATEAVIGKVQDRTESEVSLTSVENQESRMVDLGSDVGLGDSGKLNNLSLGINTVYNCCDRCGEHNNFNSTEGSESSQGAHDVAINAVKCESQGVGVSSQELLGVKLVGEVRKALDCNVPGTNSAHLDLDSPTNIEDREVQEAGSKEQIESKSSGEVVENLKCEVRESNPSPLDSGSPITNVDKPVVVVSSQDQVDVNSTGEVMDNLEYEVPSRNSACLESELSKISGKQGNTQTVVESNEVENQKFDTRVSNNIQDSIGVGSKGEDTVDEGYSKFETKTASVPCTEEFKEKEDLIDTVLPPGESDSHTDCNGESPIVTNSDVGINAALPTDTFTTSISEADKPQQEIEICDTKSVEDVLSLPADGANSESNVENGPVLEDGMLSCNRNDANSESEAALKMVDYEEKHSSLPDEDVHVETEASREDSVFLHSPSIVVDVKIESKVEKSALISSRDMAANISVACGSEVLDSSTFDGEGMLKISAGMEDVENLQNKLSGAEGRSDENTLPQGSEDTEKSLSNQISPDSAESSIADIITVDDTTVEALTKPFNFLIRIPRFNDEKIREQIMQAQLEVEEKTKLRDAIRHLIQKKRATCQTHGIEYEAAKLEDKAARKLVRSKRLEIDSLQSVINRAKNAMSIEDIDTRIHNMEHVIQHETLPLKEEKQFIREIKQLKQLREQLSSNMGSQDEIHQALDQREEVEERLKVLKKELDSLKGNVLKAEAAAMAAGRNYEDEHKKVVEHQAQFRAADEVRQEAYARLVSLKKDFFDKNKYFRMYKDAAAAASDYAFRKNREALTCHCVNQVETFMELWNTSSEFREEYVKYNVRSTLRRLGTFDGRSLGPDEKPPTLPTFVDKRVDNLVSTPAVSDSVSEYPALELKQKTPVENVVVDDKVVAESKNRVSKTKGPTKSMVLNGLEANSVKELTDDKEEEPVKSKEELELEKKAEELRKLEAEAKLREQRRLEEMAKAKEALERKKRNAEKAHMRAELRAQKEAEQREKEREKRLRKKERKKASGTEVSENNDCETDRSSENIVEPIKETEVKENVSSVTKRPPKVHHFPKQSKTKASVPAVLRNKNRKRFQQWMWLGISSFIIAILFWLGNLGAFQNLNLKPHGPVT